MDLNNLPEFFKGKRFLFIVGVLIFFLFILILLSTGSKTKPSSRPQPPQSNQLPQDSDSFSSSQKTQPVELQKAIAEQTKVDQEYAGWEQSISDNYPWRRKLPLTSENYYVYFDLDKKVFIGRLYPKAGDNPDQLKADILKQLKEVKEIPVENYTFEWQINP
ncbi:hypothetical protein HY612_05080 [Candidatus Roizmanbacteria bacterium]|nr:hypothetical protein [Candidatus Roizmanbacteria bacterium]